jgi:excisionase family DNA binding protein
MSGLGKMAAQNGTSEMVAQQSVSDPESLRRTLSVEEAGRILGISRGSAYALAKTGGIPTIRLGKRLLVPKAALDKLLGG